MSPTSACLQTPLLEALTSLGWTPGLLSHDEEEQLHRDGYLVLPGMIPAEALPGLRASFDRIAATDARSDEMLIDLLNKDPDLLRCVAHPRLLHAIGLVLQWDFKLHSVHGRNPTAVTKRQELHRDWPVGHPNGPVAALDYLICNSAWLLDDMTLENGPTRLVPGSQHTGKMPQECLADCFAAHPKEIQVEMPAGSVLVFNGHCWHSGTANRSGAPRRTIHAAFVRRSLPQPADERFQDHLRLATLRRLTPAHLTLLEVAI